MTTTEDKPPKAGRKGRRFSLTAYFFRSCSPSFGRKYRCTGNDESTPRHRRLGRRLHSAITHNRNRTDALAFEKAVALYLLSAIDSMPEEYGYFLAAYRVKSGSQRVYEDAAAARIAEQLSHCAGRKDRPALPQPN